MNYIYTASLHSRWQYYAAIRSNDIAYKIVMKLLKRYDRVKIVDHWITNPNPE